MSKKQKKDDKALGKKQKKEVKKIIDEKLNEETEFKRHYNSAANVGVSVAGGHYLTQLTEIPQGVRDYERIGEEVYLRGLDIRYMCKLIPDNTSQPYVNMRVIIFQYKDKDSNPIPGQMLNAQAANAGGGYGTFSFPDSNFTDDYVILYDKTHTLEQGTPDATNFGQTGKTVVFKERSVNIKWAKRKIQYQVGSSTLNTNGIWLLVVSDQSASSTNPRFFFTSRTMYTDS